jgi:hypothetical protein
MPKKIKNLVIMPVALYKDSDRLFAEQSSRECDYMFRFGNKIPSLEDIEEFKEVAELAGEELIVYIMGADGNLMKISNYSKAIENLDDIYYSTLDDFKEKLNDEIDQGIVDPATYRLKLMNEQAILTVTKEDAEKNKLEYIQKSMIITSLYTLYTYLLDTLNDEKAQEAIRDAIVEERIEHGEDEPTNEFDIVSNSIKRFFPADYEKIEVETCIYNNEEISHSDLVDKLSSHMLPQYLTQVDITTTLDDTYTIHTNLGDIVRERGGKITVYAKDE